MSDIRCFCSDFLVNLEFFFLKLSNTVVKWSIDDDQEILVALESNLITQELL